MENEQPVDISDKKKRKLEKRERIRQKFYEKFFNRPDIKYRGPLSYRFLRVLAWVFVILGQIVFLSSIGKTMFSWQPLPSPLLNAFNVLSAISTPLFIVASFGLVLNKKRNTYHYLLIYGLGFLGIGSGICFFYYRYIASLFVQLGLSENDLLQIITNAISDRVQINVFADLFAFALFNYFLTYYPKKVFVDKKRIIFRLFMIFPLAFVVVSYILKVLSGLGKIELPFAIFPFLTTKSPFTFLVFVFSALWIKNRERLYLRMGASLDEYHRYLTTNRNSLSFSIHLSIIIFVFAFIDLVTGFSLAVGISSINPDFMIEVIFTTFEIGQCVSLVIAIPILFLYSYTRDHNNGLIDILIPVIGIACCIFVYIEGFYQFLINYLG